MPDPSLKPTRTPLAALVLTAAACILATSTARADEVVLKSGKIRSGKVVSEDERFVVLESRLGRIRIPASEVTEIRRGDEVEAARSKESPSADPPSADDPGPASDVPTEAAKPPASDDDDATPAAETTDAPETAPRSVAPRSTGDEETEAPSDRLRRLRAGRVVRRTTAVTAAAAAVPTKTRKESTIGGRVLGKVPKGTEVIVFQPPRPFEPAPGAIEIGKRTLATMEMAGAASAWLTTAGADGEQRLAIRLADVKRHVEVTTPEARLRLFEGINGGDWVRLRTSSGQHVQGRLDGLQDGEVQVASVDAEKGATKRSIPIDTIVSVDGVIRDTAAELALTDVRAGELMAVTFWPTGDQVMGRHVDGPAGALSLDVDDDGVADHTVLRDGPLAEVRRVPQRHRDLAQILRPGNVVRARYRDDLPDASVRQTTLGAVEAVTAFALALRDGDSALIVPFDSVSDLVLIEDDPEEEIARWKTRTPREVVAEELPVLPGMPASEASRIPLEDGFSTVSDGRNITHVFVSAPFSGEVLGIRIGEPESQSTRRSTLRFDTKIVPRVDPDAPPKARQLISDSIEGLRVVLLADDLGVVTSIEISEAP